MEYFELPMGATISGGVLFAFKMSIVLGLLPVGCYHTARPATSSSELLDNKKGLYLQNFLARIQWQARLIERHNKDVK